MKRHKDKGRTKGFVTPAQRPMNWIHGMSLELEKKRLLKSQQKNYKDLMPKWWSIIVWLAIGLVISAGMVL